MVESSRCTGCGACAAICSRNAISMEPDREGFVHPVIRRDLCTDCGLCERVCPVGAEARENKIPEQSFLAMAKDETLCLKSSSGGVFSLLAERTLQNGGLVFGCEMAQDCYSAHHVGIDSPEKLGPLRGSKYLESDPEDTFRQAKAALKQGKQVLFTGTPCQIAGLQAFLSGMDTEKLLAVDVICHGVPAPDVWKRYLEELEGQFGAKAETVSFRSKAEGWQRYSLECTFQNGRVYRKSVLEDPYLRGYVENLFLRPACHNCGFKGNGYHSDLTISDFWGVGRIFPELAGAAGVSLVIAHTEKGLEAAKTLENCRMEPVKLEQALRSNPSYYGPVKPNPWRKAAMGEIRRLGSGKTLKKYCSNTLGAKIRRKLAKLMQR